MVADAADVHRLLMLDGGGDTVFQGFVRDIVDDDTLVPQVGTPHGYADFGDFVDAMNTPGEDWDRDFLGTPDAAALAYLTTIALPDSNTDDSSEDGVPWQAGRDGSGAYYAYGVPFDNRPWASTANLTLSTDRTVDEDVSSDNPGTRLMQLTTAWLVGAYYGVCPGPSAGVPECTFTRSAGGATGAVNPDLCR